MERLLEELSFDARDLADKDCFVITPEYVDSQLEELAGDTDLSRFIL